MSAVLDSVDSGADLNAGSDVGAANPASDQSGVGTLPTPAAGSPDSKGAGTPATAQPAAGANAQPAAGDPAQGDGKDKLVPVGVLRESREEVKQLRTKIAELEALPRLTPEQQKLLDKLTTQEQKVTEPQVPDFLQDPKGYIDAKAQQTADALKKLDEANSTRSKQEEAQTEFQRVVSGTSAKEQEFVKATPDYYDAVSHLRGVRSAQLQMLMPNATPQQISAQIAAEEIGAARQILQAGGDPAKFAYDYAKTVGYSPKAPAAAQPATTAAAPVDKDAARSLGGGGGAAPTEEEDPNAMPEFAAALAERFGIKKKR